MKTKLFFKHRHLFFTITTLLLLFLLTSLYYFFIKDTHTNYSFTQHFNKYYSIEDWNLAQHAIVDIDGDGKKDMITFTHCAFLTTVAQDSIPPANRCTAPGMSIIAFPDEPRTIGQKLISKHPIDGHWLEKSYLVQTDDSIWKLYHFNGLHMEVFELNRKGMFTEVQPSLRDKIDLWTYQISNISVTAVLIILSPSHWLSSWLQN